MDCRVLLTVDTELTWGHHVRGCSWRENFARSYEAAGVGIPWQLRPLAQHRLKACLFVHPLPALVHGLEPIRRMLRPILDPGPAVPLPLPLFWPDLAARRDHPLLPT